jgi:hypothetical protein
MGNNSHTGGNYIATAWTVTSDIRDKAVVANCVPHGLSFVTKLNPITYRLKSSRDDAEPHSETPPRYGFSAQDILAIEGTPSIIIDSSDPDKLKYTESSLIPVLVNAIKELTTRVEELENKLK